MKWIELFNFLNKTANNIHTFGQFNWQEEVVIHDAITGEVHKCELMTIDGKTMLTINIDGCY